MDWDPELLRLFEIPQTMLPKVLPSSGIFGYTDKHLFGSEIPIAGVAGDQQAALFGQCCFEAGDVKNTYGTGGFLLMNTGDQPIHSEQGLLTTVGWKIGDKVSYVLEGSVFVCGAAIQWLRDGLKLFSKASETEKIALSVPDSAGVYFVPAFVGLGAPYWDAYARGSIQGLTRGATYKHIVRAALEAMAYQTVDVLDAMRREAPVEIGSVRVDGGAATNNFLLQFQSDVLGVPLSRSSCVETTAKGAANLAGLAVGYYSGLQDLRASHQIDREFLPQMEREKRDQLLLGWHRAVKRSMEWAN
jgi:glycerol kinase